MHTRFVTTLDAGYGPKASYYVGVTSEPTNRVAAALVEHWGGRHIDWRGMTLYVPPEKHTIGHFYEIFDFRDEQYWHLYQERKQRHDAETV